MFGQVEFSFILLLEKCKMLIIKRHLSEVTKHIPSDRDILSKDEEKSDVLFLAQPLTCFVALSLSTFWFYISQKYVAI